MSNSDVIIQRQIYTDRNVYLVKFWRKGKRKHTEVSGKLFQKSATKVTCGKVIKIF